MKEFEMFLDCGNNPDTLQAFLNAAEADGYVMANDFDHRVPDAMVLLKSFKNCYHGNSKLLLHFYTNKITGRKEIDFGTRSVYRSYPQYRNMHIVKV